MTHEDALTLQEVLKELKVLTKVVAVDPLTSRLPLRWSVQFEMWPRTLYVIDEIRILENIPK